METEVTREATCWGLVFIVVKADWIAIVFVSH